MVLVGVPTNLLLIVLDHPYHQLIFDVLVYRLLSCYLLVRTTYRKAFFSVRFHISLSMNYPGVRFFFFKKN